MRAQTLPLLLTALVILTLLSPIALAGDVEVQLPAGDGFVVKDNTGAVERLRVDEATGNVSRNGALFVHTTGKDNTFVGQGAGNTSTTGYGSNSALGMNALSSNTTGFYNSAFGESSLFSNTTGTANSAFGQDALYSNTTGFWNSAFGNDTLRQNSTGHRNSAFGYGALAAHTTSFGNSAFGKDALASTTVGYRNAAFGEASLRFSTTGVQNAAFGHDALRYNTTGHFNSAFGVFALRSNTTGDRNVALGLRAGYNQTTGDRNVYIAHEGAAGEGNRIRIGTPGMHSLTFIAGIAGSAVSGSPVLMNTLTHQLDVAPSSARFKEEIRDIGDESESLMALRPVSFRYRAEVVEGERRREYGLVAEEVAEVAPNLVSYDDEGLPFSVRYQLLTPLLLNEMQKQQRRDGEQQRTIETLLARVRELERQVSADATAGGG